jgi:hypothetical protein
MADIEKQTKLRWDSECERLGLDPFEVRKVSQRYDMYRNYTEQQAGQCLPLERWYKWYRIEKLSEGHATRMPPAAGCSIEPGAEDEQPVVSEREFLGLLKLLRGG